MATSSAVLTREPVVHRPEPGITGPSARRSPTVLAAALAASWAVPLLLHTVALDVLLLPVLVLTIAALIRVGGGLLDRLVVAAFLLCGAVMGLGLLFSVWPWGLAPVPGAGLMLTIASVSGWLARRRPRIPLRLRGSDALIAGTVAVVWHYVHHPVAGRPAAERLAYFVTSEDRMGHFSYFTGIREVGGYAFLHQDAARAYMMTPSEAVYPQGSHFLLAWIDALVTSSVQAGSALAMTNRYFIYVLACYALFCGALVWAARWIGGPRLRGWRAAAVCATVAAVMMSGSMAQLIERGFDSETIGLLFLAVALALLVRPAVGRTEFVLTAAAGLIAVTFVYNLYGALVGIALAAVLLIHRRRFTGRWIPVLAALAGVTLVAGLPSVFSVLTKLDVAKTSNLAGPMVIPDRPVFIGLGLLALVAATLPVNRRTGTGQMVLALVLGAAAMIGAFGAWQKHTIGYYSYYFEKLTAAGLVIALLSLGLIGLMLPPAGGTAGPALRRRADLVLRSGLAAAAALALFGGVQWGVPSGWGHPSAWYDSPMLKWTRGEARNKDIAAPARTLTGRDLQGAASPVIALYSNDSFVNLQSTFLAQILTKQGGTMVGLYEVFHVKVGGPAAVEEKEYQVSLGRLKTAIASCPSRPTVLVGDLRTADRIRQDLAAAGTEASVVHAPLR
ncbi:hypothetical protein [Streptomyces yangpuensis]|uniref:hypothetical protein n=1 Tax=Streptomyces yangpuensis TaxID=1648182 RepID=UPI0006298AD0|nr:hypothetical protein [Streptomyces yangpuensis]